ncbi:DUF6880 family protein [Allosediminivita pacifica]|uniref:Uncharacterized protein n=1 Tax=Allosediminivita pacifica TaxID=1267769 RepID=A0A2T6ANU1_9RHOB|nr:DUF6880 family protein [Allosediminivita pacifica]PTX45489.1 hypothetical protein C8N44_12110 [Allosediminivita pacifica]GGB19857.1 hypothetical protein GCM10011324_32420 [Allosediminivita pacifica]
MAGTAVSRKNLVEPGADTVAGLLLNAVKADAARQRRVRLVLAAGQGPATVTAGVR